MTTGEVARRLGISTSTVRKWADVFSDFLSEAATPGYGGDRDFTEEDLQLLSAVAYYRKQEHLSFDEIEAKLRRGDHLRELVPKPPSTEGEPRPSPSPGAADLSLLRREVQQLREALWALDASLKARLDELEQHLREEAEPPPAYAEMLQEHLEALHALQRRIDEIRGALITREQIRELQERLQQEMELLQALPNRLDPAREAAAIRERLQRLGEELHQRLEVIQVQDDFNAERQLNRLKELRQRLEMLQETVVAREQLREWEGKLQRFQDALENLTYRLEGLHEMLATREQVAGLHVELERQWELLRALQELPDHVGALHTEFAEFQAKFREHADENRSPRPLAQTLIQGLQSFSWAVLLVAVLGALYYLNLDIWLTALLAVLITGGLWSVSRRVMR